MDMKNSQETWIFDVLYDLVKASMKSGNYTLCEDLASIARAYDRRIHRVSKLDEITMNVQQLAKFTSAVNADVAPKFVMSD